MLESQLSKLNRLSFMKKHLRRSSRALFSPKLWKVRLVFWLGAVIIGLVCAAFAILAEHANHLFLQMANYNPYLPLIVTPLALVAIAWTTQRYFPGAQGSGIPQTIAALESKSRSTIISLRIAIGKVLLTVAGLLAGASIGREGPSVHIGASIMHSMGKFAQFPPHYMERGLILAGSAAGVAAAFNTPLAGIVFAIEEMNRQFNNKINSLVAIAVVVAGITAMSLQGNYVYFGQSNAEMTGLSSWQAVLICGLAGGLLGGLFANLLIYGSQALAPVARKKPLMVAFVAGLSLALVAYMSDYSASGTGYIEATAIINGTGAWDPWYPLNKMLATLASYLSGIPGGIFAPALATGAGVGADLGHWFPVAPLSVMVLLGMLAYFCGVVQAPLTAFVIVMEMTGDTGMSLALIATSYIAYGASHLVCPKPLYSSLAEAFLDRNTTVAKGQ